ncbi:hypothetical protein LINPERHAP2_LOCUS25264 [Linum perenne]
MAAVQGRALRSDTAVGYDHVVEGSIITDQSAAGAGIASFVATSSNSSEGNEEGASSVWVLQGLMYKLASGPSKRGRGH